MIIHCAQGYFGGTGETMGKECDSINALKIFISSVGKVKIACGIFFLYTSKHVKHSGESSRGTFMVNQMRVGESGCVCLWSLCWVQTSREERIFIHTICFSLGEVGRVGAKNVEFGFKFQTYLYAHTSLGKLFHLSLIQYALPYHGNVLVRMKWGTIYDIHMNVSHYYH